MGKENRKRKICSYARLKKILIAVIAIGCVLLIIAPILITVCYNITPKLIYTDLTAGDMLSFIGTSIAALIALGTLIIAILFNRQEKIAKMYQQFAKFKPKIILEALYKNNRLKIRITNIGDYYFSDVYIENRSISRYIAPGKTVTKEYDFNNGTYDFLFENGELMDDYYPKVLLISATDFYGNDRQLLYKFSKDQNQQDYFIYEYKEEIFI